MPSRPRMMDSREATAGAAAGRHGPGDALGDEGHPGLVLDGRDDVQGSLDAHACVCRGTGGEVVGVVGEVGELVKEHVWPERVDGRGQSALVEYVADNGFGAEVMKYVSLVGGPGHGRDGVALLDESGDEVSSEDS